MAQVKAMTVLSRRLPRKRKKRKKKKLPRDGSSCGRARRRHRQWHVPGRIGGLVRLHAVFPSFFGRNEWPGFLGGMDEKDSYAMAAPVVEPGSGMCYAGIAGCVAPRVLLPSVVDRPRCSIMAVMDQKDSALVVNHGSGTCLVCFPGVPAPRAQDARHHGLYEPEGHLCGMVLVVPTAENCEFYTVAVFRRSSIFLSWCRGRFPWSCCSADHRNSPVDPQHGDRCPCCSGRAGSFVYGIHLFEFACENRIMDVSGRLLPDGFRIQLLLVQHWIHVYVSFRRSCTCSLS